ncbi:hypothetical protein N2152v2_003755 [Parachlorella kessleri]
MLRTVLGTAGQSSGENNSKLLELADRDGDTPHANGDTHAHAQPTAVDEEDEHDHEAPPGISSVITQVVVRQEHSVAQEPAAQPRLAAGEDQEVRNTWKNKLRSILCCLAPPANDQYVRQDEGPVVIRPPAPPPPTWSEPVIGPIAEEDRGKKTLVLDLDETLVHSSFKPIPQPDYVIPVEIEGRIVDVYVLKRPFVDHFLRTVGHRFEVVVFTASLGKYADPLLDLLDKANVVRWRLFREACCPYEGSYVKDLQCLGRDLCDVIIVDNSPHSYIFQPENALPIGTFIDDPQDQELLDCLETLLAVERADDVRKQLAAVLARKGAGVFTGFGSAVGAYAAAGGASDGAAAVAAAAAGSSLRQ